MLLKRCTSKQQPQPNILISFLSLFDFQVCLWCLVQRIISLIKRQKRLCCSYTTETKLNKNTNSNYCKFCILSEICSLWSNLPLDIFNWVVSLWCDKHFCFRSHLARLFKWFVSYEWGLTNFLSTGEFYNINKLINRYSYKIDTHFFNINYRFVVCMVLRMQYNLSYNHNNQSSDSMQILSFISFFAHSCLIGWNDYENGINFIIVILDCEFD